MPETMLLRRLLLPELKFHRSWRKPGTGTLGVQARRYPATRCARAAPPPPAACTTTGWCGFAMKLPRFRGHLSPLGRKGDHDAEEPIAIPAGVPPTDGRAGASGTHA